MLMHTDCGQAVADLRLSTLIKNVGAKVTVMLVVILLEHYTGGHLKEVSAKA